MSPLAILLIALSGFLVGGCGREQVVRVTAAEQLDGLVGRRVELFGIVTTNRVPQVLGVDLWGMEHLSGHRVRVSGVLQRTIINNTARGKDSGNDGFVPPVLRGPGTYYRLQDAKYVFESKG